jgi:hypothetical protein
LGLFRLQRLVATHGRRRQWAGRESRVIDQGVCWRLGPWDIILAVDKGMRVDEERLFLVVVIVLGVSRHGAQVAAGSGRTGLRVFLDLAHQMADGILYRIMRRRWTHGPKIVKSRRQRLVPAKRNREQHGEVPARMMKDSNSTRGRARKTRRKCFRAADCQKFGWRWVSRLSSHPAPREPVKARSANPSYWLSRMFPRSI